MPRLVIWHALRLRRPVGPWDDTGTPRSERKNTLGFRLAYSLIRVGVRDPGLRAFWLPVAKTKGVFFHACFQAAFSDESWVSI